MNILVTGGAGFIGSHVTKRLVKKGHVVTVIDNLDPYYSLKLKMHNIDELHDCGVHAVHQMNISDYEKLENIFRKLRPEIVIHLAARAGVRNSVEYPRDYVKVNVEGTQHILECSKKFDVQKVMIASSSSVYGANKRIPFSESQKVDRQESPYAASKKAMETIARTYAYTYKVPVQLFRFFTVYGPSGRPDMAPVLFTKAIDEGKEITVFGGLHTQRDYTYVDDIVDGLVRAIPIHDLYEVYNLGNNVPVSLGEFIETIAGLLHKEPKILIGQKRVGDMERTWANIEKAQKAFGYAPKHDLQSGMKKFITWYITHKNLYEIRGNKK